MSFTSFLLKRGIIDSSTYDIVEKSNSINSENIVEFLCGATSLSENEITCLKAQYYGLDYISDQELYSLASSIEYLSMGDSQIIPYKVIHEKQEIEIAIDNPENLIELDNIKKILSKNQKTKDLNIKFKVARKSSIASLTKKPSTNNNKIDDIFTNGIHLMASDIHLSPYESIFEIKYRIDGELKTVKTLPIDEFNIICVAIKVMAKLDISETRRPQSGHFQKDDIDFRISTHPTIYGENICIRILNKNKNYINIENIGFDSLQIEYLKRISQFSHGMIIFCGPTGSGKTTSIYSMLATVDKKVKNIMTLEDPVEYKIHGVKQTELKNGVIDFSSGVRSTLRQDPDIIFIGEIRDKETAEVAIRASMTGHLVFTTIHSNDSIGAIKRFQDFGISPFLVADNIISIISQRLIRKMDGGRTIISEILHIDEKINELIYENACKERILKHATQFNSFRNMYEDCAQKLKNGTIDKKEAEKIMRN